MDVGPPANDITAPPTTGGLGMIPTGLASVGRRATQPAAGTMTMGGSEGESERFDSGGHETTFSSGSPSSSSSQEGKSGGWWPFGGSS